LANQADIQVVYGSLAGGDSVKDEPIHQPTQGWLLKPSTRPGTVRGLSRCHLWYVRILRGELLLLVAGGCAVRDHQADETLGIVTQYNSLASVRPGAAPHAEAQPVE
jgi:hypothetical protein